MNQELYALFMADQAERKRHPAFDTPEYWQLRKHDAQRRQRTNELIAQGLLTTSDDYFHAASIFQHGATLDDIWQAHELARRAAAMETTEAASIKRRHWLVAATLDRWLIYQGKTQKYGTQFVSDGERYRLWDVDPTTTDDERAANHVPSLQEQLQRAERYTQEDPLYAKGRMDKNKAPEWMREALKRWEQENS